VAPVWGSKTRGRADFSGTGKLFEGFGRIAIGGRQLEESVTSKRSSYYTMLYAGTGET